MPLVIVLTSSLAVADLKGAYQMGATSFLGKPCTVEEFLDVQKACPKYWIRPAEPPGSLPKSITATIWGEYPILAARCFFVKLFVDDAAFQRQSLSGADFAGRRPGRRGPPASPRLQASQCSQSTAGRPGRRRSHRLPRRQR